MSTFPSQMDLSMYRRRRIVVVLASAIIAGCASPLLSNPAAEASRLICETLMANEQLRRDQSVFVLDETAPVYRLGGLHVISSKRSPTPEDLVADIEKDNRLALTHQPNPVTLVQDHSCSFHQFAGSIESKRLEGELVLQLSNLITNPFSPKPERGRFLRLSIGGRHRGTWYWIRYRCGREDCLPTTMVKLPIDES